MSSTATKQYQDVPVPTKHILSALWVATLFVFAYVDIFGFFRADVLNAALEGEISTTGLAANQTFFLATTLYILLPSLMVVLSLTLRPKANRVFNIVLSLLYTLTIVGSCIGETWTYYLIGSAVEVVLLLLIARTAWTWPPAQVGDRPRQQPLAV